MAKTIALGRASRSLMLGATSYHSFGLAIAVKHDHLDSVVQALDLGFPLLQFSLLEKVSGVLQFGHSKPMRAARQSFDVYQYAVEAMLELIESGSGRPNEPEAASRSLANLLLSLADHFGSLLFKDLRDLICFAVLATRQWEGQRDVGAIERRLREEVLGQREDEEGMEDSTADAEGLGAQAYGDDEDDEGLDERDLANAGGAQKKAGRERVRSEAWRAAWRTRTNRVFRHTARQPASGKVHMT